MLIFVQQQVINKSRPAVFPLKVGTDERLASEVQLVIANLFVTPYKHDEKNKSCLSAVCHNGSVFTPAVRFRLHACDRVSSQPSTEFTATHDDCRCAAEETSGAQTKDASLRQEANTELHLPLSPKSGRLPPYHTRASRRVNTLKMEQRAGKSFVH